MCVTGAEGLGGSYTVVSPVCPAKEIIIYVHLKLAKLELNRWQMSINYIRTFIM